MNKLPKKKKEHIAVVIMGAAFLAGILWVAMISPLRAKLGQLATQVADSRRQVDLGQRTIASAKQVAEDLENASQQLQMAERAMATGDLYAWMIQTMNQFKLSHKVSIPQISREIPCEAGVLPNFPYRAAAFVVRGSAFYHDLGSFVADFENSFPYMRLQNLELDAMGGPQIDESERERLQFKMEIVTLVKPLMP